MLSCYFYSRGGGPYQAFNLPIKVLGQNCCGICNAITVKSFKAQIKGNSSDVIFLCETKASTTRMKEVLKSINFADMCVVEAKGTAGGICIMWKSGFSIHQVDYNKNLVALKLSDTVCD